MYSQQGVPSNAYLKRDVATPICFTHVCTLTLTLTTEHPEYVPGKQRWPEFQLAQDKLTCEWQMAEVAIAVSHLLRRDSKQTLQCCGWPLARATHPMHSTSVIESCPISTMQAVISSGQCSRLPYSCTTERSRSGESHSHARPPPSSNIENTANRQNAKSSCECLCGLNQVCPM